MVEIRWNSEHAKGEITVKLEEAIKKWKEHTMQIKKRKEEETLNLQDNKHNLEEEKYEK